MGGVINVVAFPAPQLPMEFYDRELLRGRSDLCWMMTSKNERIPACYVQARPDDFFGSQRMTFLYSHGNAEDLALHLDYIDALAAFTGADVFSYEYVGYATSRHEGHDASEEGCIRSIDAAWRYCVDELKLHPKQMGAVSAPASAPHLAEVLFGRSIGSGPTVDLASREVVEGTEASPMAAAGVLLQSPLESGARAVIGPVTSFVGYPLDIFRNYEKVGNIPVPVAIMHGTCDEVVPCDNGRALHSRLAQPFDPLWVEGYGHNNLPQDMCFGYAKRFVDWLDSRARSGSRRTALGQRSQGSSPGSPRVPGVRGVGAD